MASWQRYNPNFGKGIHSGNAWKLTTVRGGEWAAMKQAEGRGCPPGTSSQAQAKPALDQAMDQKLAAAQKNGHGITKPELAQIINDTLGGAADLSAVQRSTLKKWVDTKASFARQSTRNIAMQIATGTPVAVAATQYALGC